MRHVHRSTFTGVHNATTEDPEYFRVIARSRCRHRAGGRGLLCRWSHPTLTWGTSAARTGAEKCAPWRCQVAWDPWNVDADRRLPRRRFTRHINAIGLRRSKGLLRGSRPCAAAFHPTLLADEADTWLTDELDDLLMTNYRQAKVGGLPWTSPDAFSNECFHRRPRLSPRVHPSVDQIVGQRFAGSLLTQVANGAFQESKESRHLADVPTIDLTFLGRNCRTSTKHRRRAFG